MNSLSFNCFVVKMYPLINYLATQGFRYPYASAYTGYPTTTAYKGYPYTYNTLPTTTFNTAYNTYPYTYGTYPYNFVKTPVVKN